jgi:hypothetical protein
LHQHATVCGAAEEAESATQKELEANTLASSDNEVKDTGTPSIVINETKYEDKLSESDSESSSNIKDEMNLLPSNWKNTISDESSDSNDDNISDYQSSGMTDDVDTEYPIKSVLQNEVDTTNDLSNGALPPNGDTVTGLTNENKSTIEPVDPVENEAPVDHSKIDTAQSCREGDSS